ncbi:MAG: alpha/beta hydrolase [Flavobacteriales bacterium]
MSRIVPILFLFFCANYAVANNPPSTIELKNSSNSSLYFIHGTHSRTKVWNKELRAGIREIFAIQEKSDSVELFSWSGHNNSLARENAAKKLTTILSSDCIQGAKITLVGHSHGGNVVILTAKSLVNLFPKATLNVVLLNTPSTNQYQFTEKELKQIAVYDIYNPDDIVIPRAGHSKTNRLTRKGKRKLGVYPIDGEKSKPHDSIENGGATFGHHHVKSKIIYTSFHQGRFRSVFNHGIDWKTGHRGWHEENVRRWLPLLDAAVNNTKAHRNSGWKNIKLPSDVS